MLLEWRRYYGNLVLKYFVAKSAQGAQCGHRNDVDSTPMSLICPFAYSLCHDSSLEIDMLATLDVKLTSFRCGIYLSPSATRHSLCGLIGCEMRAPGPGECLALPFPALPCSTLTLRVSLDGP